MPALPYVFFPVHVFLLTCCRYYCKGVVVVVFLNHPWYCSRLLLIFTKYDFLFALYLCFICYAYYSLSCQAVLFV